jgi:predicted TIM-barrel fold metal-dependent hydrolase
MPAQLTRRQLIAGALAASSIHAARPDGTLVDTHIHLFDPLRFPYHPNGTYQPPAALLEDYAKFVAAARIQHTIVVHPEPYQDDHRYLEYCFAHEPSRGFFKGTCLFDPVAPETPRRMEDLAQRNKGRIVAMRIHEMRTPGAPPTTSGAIKDRDMQSPAMENTWRKAQQLGLAIQMHFLPHFAPQIGALARKFDLPVILDHLARAGQGTPADFDEVLKLAKLPRVYMKYSGVAYSSKQPFPHPDAKLVVRRAFDAFGPDRMIWGGLGHSMADFEKQAQLFDAMFDFAAEKDRAKIRGLTAMKLFRF